ncbi:MAG TPA: cation:proton antiporter [Bryobacteraceae bacterium]|nr:cation:proton antiporter [Bryobacteraceae bacterium]
MMPVALLASAGSAIEIPLAMLLVFGSAKLLAELFERVGQPGIVGEIIAGILIGPSVLGWIRPNELLTALSELGVMFLLFRVGLEVKASELMRVGPVASLVAILGVVVPLGLGWGIMQAFGYPQIESVFVGAAMVATSVGITARVLAAKGLLHLLASRIILAAAVIDDVLGLLVLAVVSSMARGTVNVVEIGTTAVLAIGFTLLIARWGTLTAARFIPAAGEKLRAGEGQFNVALVVLFALSVLAVYAGVAAIIGAFLAGMALAESVSHRVHDLAHGITELLVPFFLAGIGLHLDLSAFTSPSTVLLTLAILVAAILSKLVGCGAGALKLGRTNMFRIGVGMVPRGEVGMVVAQIGLSMGVVEQSIYGVVVFMSIATTIAAPPLLNAAFRDAPQGTPEEQFQLG